MRQIYDPHHLILNLSHFCRFECTKVYLNELWFLCDVIKEQIIVQSKSTLKTTNENFTNSSKSTKKNFFIQLKKNKHKNFIRIKLKFNEHLFLESWFKFGSLSYRNDKNLRKGHSLNLFKRKINKISYKKKNSICFSLKSFFFIYLYKSENCLYRKKKLIARKWDGCLNDRFIKNKCHILLKKIFLLSLKSLYMKLSQRIWVI